VYALLVAYILLFVMCLHLPQAFQIEEHMAQNTSELVMRRFRDRMQTAEAESEVCGGNK